MVDDKGMKLLLASGHPAGSVTGLGLAFDMLVSGLRERGIPFEVVEKAAMEENVRQGAFQTGHALNTLRTLLRLWTRLGGASLLYMPVASSHFGFIRDALSIWPARLLGKRVVLHLHGGGYLDFYKSLPRRFAWVVRKTLTRADTLIVLGELLKDQFGFVPGAARKTRVVPNGLPEGLRSREGMPKELPPKGEPLRLLYMANMIESKGYLATLEACRVLREAGLDFRCDFCGSFLKTAVDSKGGSAEDAREIFLGLIRKWGLTACVHYNGLVTGAAKESLLSASHVLLFPTTYPWEGQPLNIIEALAFGTPAVTTRFKGIPEEVVDGWNGFFVEGDAPGDMAARVLRMAGDPDLYRRLSRNAMEHYRMHFTREAHLARLIPVILGDPEESPVPTLEADVCESGREAA